MCTQNKYNSCVVQYKTQQKCRRKTQDIIVYFPVTYLIIMLCTLHRQKIKKITPRRNIWYIKCVNNIRLKQKKKWVLALETWLVVLSQSGAESFHLKNFLHSVYNTWKYRHQIRLEPIHCIKIKLFTIIPCLVVRLCRLPCAE